MKLRIEGLDELQEYLDGVIEKLESDEFWNQGLEGILQKARRYAASISPVVSGSYQASHRVVVGANGVELFIDPSARNTQTGLPVTRYATPVEKKHRVYALTAVFAHRLAVQGAERLGEDLLQ